MRAIAFSRVSTSKQDEGVRQIQQIQKYCTENGYQLIEDKTISEIVSGVADERTGLNELMQLSKSDADIIIVSEASRLTRKSEDDFMDLYSIVKAIQSTGLDLFILGSSQTYTADKKLTLVDVITLVIEADRNAKEREQSKVRFKTGKEKKLLAGGYIGHTMPFGYINNEQKADYFSINEEEASIIKLMFDLVANQGYTLNQTALYLHRLYNLNWKESHVRVKIMNTVYKGEFKIMNTVINVPAIVDVDLWNIAQSNISTNHLSVNKGTKNFNGLKGIIKCPCGCNMFIANIGKGVKTYKCTTKSNGYKYVENCENVGINSDTVSSIVWNITQKYINVDDFKAKTDEQKQLIAIEIKAIERRNSALLADKAELSTKIDSLVNNIIEADKSIQPILNKKLSELVAAGGNIDKQIEKLNIESSKANNKLKDLSISLLPALIGNITDAEKNEIYKKYIDSVVYHSVKLHKGFIVIRFINKVETIVMYSNRPLTAYALPSTFFFNPITKTVIESKGFESKEAKILYKIFEGDSVGDNRALQLLASATTPELTYDDMKANYPMNDYLMKL